MLVTRLAVLVAGGVLGGALYALGAGSVLVVVPFAAVAAVVLGECTSSSRTATGRFKRFSSSASRTCRRGRAPTRRAASRSGSSVSTRSARTSSSFVREATIRRSHRRITAGDSCGGFRGRRRIPVPDRRDDDHVLLAERVEDLRLGAVPDDNRPVAPHVDADRRRLEPELLLDRADRRPRAEHEGDALALPLADVVGDALGERLDGPARGLFRRLEVLGDRDARDGSEFRVNLPSR